MNQKVDQSRASAPSPWRDDSTSCGKTFTHAEKLKFPLPDNYFPTIDIALKEHQWHADRMHSILQKALEEEYWYYRTAYRSVDDSQWSQLQRKRDLRIYKFTGNRIRSENTHLLAIGSIRGTVEDIMYGIHTNSTDELQATTQFHEDVALDAAMLAILEKGTHQDPYHFLGVKWRMTKTPGGRFIRNRDTCGMEYLGMKQNDRGERYGFHIIEPFSHPLWPPFPQKYSIRGSAHVRCIYRQIHPEIVGVYMEGDVEFHGMIPHFLVRKTLANVFSSIEKTIPCAEAKRLTILASQWNETLEDGENREPTFSRSTAARALNCTDCLHSKTVKQCQICWTQCCLKCCVQKSLLARRGSVMIVCCIHCLKESNKYRSEPNKRLVFGRPVKFPVSNRTESNRTAVAPPHFNPESISESQWYRMEGILSECSTESSPRSSYDFALRAVMESINRREKARGT